MKYVFLYSAIFANVLTNVGFNLSAINDATPSKKWGFLIGGLVFGLLNSVLFTESLKEIPLHVASSIMFSLTIVGLFIVSYFFFNETITIWKLVGATLITSGVVVISMK